MVAKARVGDLDRLGEQAVADQGLVDHAVLGQHQEPAVERTTYEVQNAGPPASGRAAASAPARLLGEEPGERIGKEDRGA